MLWSVPNKYYVADWDQHLVYNTDITITLCNILLEDGTVVVQDITNTLHSKEESKINTE